MELCSWTSLLIVFITYKLVFYLLRLPLHPLSAKTKNIFVTGCDTGFGEAFARKMDGRGFTVYAGCLTDEGCARLREVCSSRIQPIKIDVRDDDSVQRAAERVRELLAQEELWAVVNNAGANMSMGVTFWLKKEDYDTDFDVNFHGMRRVCDAFLPMLKRSRGRIVNTTSVGGRVGGSPFTAYCATKYAAEAYSDAIRIDLMAFNVGVHIIEPCVFKTQLQHMAVVRAKLTRSWDNLTENAKKEYGKDYINKYVKAYEDQWALLVLNDLSPVIDAYEHAVLAKWPRIRYLVGDNKKIFWLFLTLPTWITDRIRYVSFPRPSLPQ